MTYLALLAYAIFLSLLGTEYNSSSLPAIAQYFDISMPATQATYYIFMSFFAISPLIYAPFSDFMGRKKIYIYSTLIFAVSCFLTMTSTSIYQLYIYRAIQGFTNGVVFVTVCGAMVDLSKKEKTLVRYYSYYEIVYGLALILMPLLGSYVQHYYGWQANYFVMGVLSLSIVVLYTLFFKETNIKQKYKISINKCFYAHVGLLNNRRYIFLIFSGSSLLVFFSIFYSFGPFIVETVLHGNSINFGIIAFGSGLIYMLGALINMYLIKRCKIRSICNFGYIIVFIGIAGLIILYLLHRLNLNNFAYSIYCIEFGMGFIYANIHTLVVKCYPDVPAMANSQLMFVLSASTVIMVLILSAINTKPSLYVFVISYTIIAVITLIFYIIGINCNEKTVSSKKNNM
ncbi:MAG: multidrug effflux MFS transporter [bacterium]|nr:multidrug effflux MFS transporter [bacterium]